MQNHFLIKRSPSFSNKGLIVKRSQKGKKYSETRISSDNRSPLLKDFKLGDMVYVAEKDWGIYASGQVVDISDLFIASSLEDIIGYIVDEKKKGEVYWFDKLTRFHKKKQKKGGKPVEFKYQEYTINQKLFTRPIPLVAELSRLSKPAFASPMIRLTEDEVSFIQKPTYRDNEIKLSLNIPYALKLDVWGFFNTRLAIQHFIDIDHFVPKSAGGPGNIIENLVPIGSGLNRYKSNSIPRGFFTEAGKHDKLKHLTNDNNLLEPGEFISSKQAKHDAHRINMEIAKWESVDDIRAFYRAVLDHHVPEHGKTIDEYRKSRGY